MAECKQCGRIIRNGTITELCDECKNKPYDFSKPEVKINKDGFKAKSKKKDMKKVMDILQGKEESR